MTHLHTYQVLTVALTTGLRSRHSQNMGYSVRTVLMGLLLVVATSHGFPAENSDLCHSATCGLGATCSQVSNLIVCTCLDGYEGDAFKECIPASTTVSSQPSSSLPATTFQTTSTVASTTPSSTTTATTTTTTGPSTSETVFNIPVRTQTYHEVTRTESPVQPVQIQQHHTRQEQLAVVTEDSLLQQYPSAPPTLSHYAPAFQQKLHAQPIQFGSSGAHSSQSQAYPPPAPVTHHVHRINSDHGEQQYRPELFEGTRTRDRPQQQGHLGPINGQTHDEKYYYQDNVHQSAHNRVNYQGSSSSSIAEVGSASGSYNLPFNIHHSHQNQHSNHPSPQSNHGGSRGDVGPLLGGSEQDYRRRPILGNGNANRYPVSNNNGNNNPGPEDDIDDGMRDATFIKDPLGKYEKCHSVNNIIVCADSTNTGAESSAKHHHRVASSTQKPLETRRIDTRPTGSNSHFNGMGQSRIPTFPAAAAGGSHRVQNHHLSQSQQQTTYYPTYPSSKYPESTSSTNSQQNNHNFEAQFPQRYPSPVSDFTSPSSVGPRIPSTTNDISTTANSICQRFCGEGAVCRIILDRPVCGCSEGHTGDPTIRCSPILNSKYDSKSCQRHTDCLQTDVCHQSRCVDPCDETARTSRSNRCGFNATCRVIEHTQLCSCNDGFNGNPYLGCT